MNRNPRRTVACSGQSVAVLVHHDLGQRGEAAHVLVADRLLKKSYLCRGAMNDRIGDQIFKAEARAVARPRIALDDPVLGVLVDTDDDVRNLVQSPTRVVAQIERGIDGRVKQPPTSIGLDLVAGVDEIKLRSEIVERTACPFLALGEGA